MENYDVVLHKDEATQNIVIMLLLNGQPTGTYMVFAPPVTERQLIEQLEAWQQFTALPAYLDLMPLAVSISSQFAELNKVQLLN